MPLVFLVSMLTTILVPFLAGLLGWPIWVVVLVGAWATYSYFSTRSRTAVNPVVLFVVSILSSVLMIGLLFLVGYGIRVFFL